MYCRCTWPEALPASMGTGGAYINLKALSTVSRFLHACWGWLDADLLSEVGRDARVRMLFRSTRKQIRL